MQLYDYKTNLQIYFNSQQIKFSSGINVALSPTRQECFWTKSTFQPTISAISIGINGLPQGFPSCRVSRISQKWEIVDTLR